MKAHRPLTRLAHERLAEVLQAGDLAIDATAGNGHDTLFLARQVGPRGRVCAFDIQLEALQNTARRLEAEGLLRQVQLAHAGHQYLLEHLPDGWSGKVSAVTFNLGYLPGSDKRTITRSDATLPALAQSLQCLRPGGLLSVLAYRGHEGGQEEADAVLSWLTEQRAQLALETHESPGPVLYLGQRL